MIAVLAVMAFTAGVMGGCLFVWISDDRASTMLRRELAEARRQNAQLAEELAQARRDEAAWQSAALSCLTKQR